MRLAVQVVTHNSLSFRCSMLTLFNCAIAILCTHNFLRSYLLMIFVFVFLKIDVASNRERRKIGVEILKKKKKTPATKYEYTQVSDTSSSRHFFFRFNVDLYVLIYVLRVNDWGNCMIPTQVLVTETYNSPTHQRTPSTYYTHTHTYEHTHSHI